MTGDAPRLETERMILRGAQVSDLAPLARIRAKEEVGRHVGGVRDYQDTWFMMLRGPGMWNLLGYGYWLIDLKETGDLIGEVGFADFKRGMTPDLSGTPEAGWVIDSPHWGKGLMTEAVMAIHQWLDTETDYTRSTCIIEPSHTPSIRVAEKAGYTKLCDSEYRGAPVTVFERHRQG